MIFLPSADGESKGTGKSPQYKRGNTSIAATGGERPSGPLQDGNPRLPRTIEEIGSKGPVHRVRARFSAIDLDRYRSFLDLMKRGFRLVHTEDGYALRKGGAETTVSARMADELMQSCLVHKIHRHGQPQYMVRRRIESPFERMQRGVDHAVGKMSGGGGDGQAGASFKDGGASLPSIAEDKQPASRKQRDLQRSHARQS